MTEHLMVNIVPFLGRDEFRILRRIVAEHRETFRGVGWLKGGRLDDIYAVFEFNDHDELEAVKQEFSRILNEDMGYKSKNPVRVRKRLPKNLRLLVPEL